MVTVLKDKKDFICAYIEWHVVDEEGKLDDFGTHIFIYDLWIHPFYRKTRALNYLIHKVDKDPKSYSARWVYWRNNRRNHVTKCFSRKRLGRMGLKK